MSRDTIWSNDDGLTVGFGTRAASNAEAANINTAGYENEVRLVVDVADLGTALDATEGGFANSVTIPAGSSITGARIAANVAVATVTAVQVGTAYISSVNVPTLVDIDSLVTATNGAVANLNAAGKTVVGSGAIVNGPSHATEAVFPFITRTGSAGTGEVEVVISYRTATAT